VPHGQFITTDTTHGTGKEKKKENQPITNSLNNNNNHNNNCSIDILKRASPCVWNTDNTLATYTYIHTYIHTGFIGIWQPEAGLNKHSHINKQTLLWLNRIDQKKSTKTYRRIENSTVRRIRP